ncbi:MAG TPA: CPBP family intramembrane metalloprotease [Nocardioides sp.]|nr:CPBP family intramembrane metalloprotease [Nocardioides sp.]
MPSQTDIKPESGLRGFLDKGGFWRLLAVVAIYLALYLGAGKVASFFDPGYGDDDLLSSVGAVFFQLTVGLIVGAVILVTLTTAMGWNAEIFGRQPIYRSWWMWIAPVLVATPILLRVLDIDWGGPALSVVLLVLASGLMIGFVEELLYRGIAVKMLRAVGHGEWTVAALSSLLFGLSHSINVFSGQGLKTVLPTVGYTVAFGVMMYLSMRAIGFIAGAMILHGLTDPTGFLATGGIDKLPSAGEDASSLATLVGFATILLVLTAYVLLIFIRGNVRDHQEHQEAVAVTAA